MTTEEHIPVPQADDLDKVFMVVELVADGVTTAEDIAERLEVVQRQGFYYSEAAHQLGLIEKDDKHWELTARGASWIAAGDREMMKWVVVKHPLIRAVLTSLGVRRPTYKSHHHLLEDEKYVADVIEELGYSHETAHRRALTIKAWMHGLA